MFKCQLSRRRSHLNYSVTATAYSKKLHRMAGQIKTSPSAFIKTNTPFAFRHSSANLFVVLSVVAGFSHHCVRCALPSNPLQCQQMICAVTKNIKWITESVINSYACEHVERQLCAKITYRREFYNVDRCNCFTHSAYNVDGCNCFLSSLSSEWRLTQSGFPQLLL